MYLPLAPSPLAMSSELTAGRLVEVFGLVSAAQRNGSRGLLLQFEAGKGRWMVKLESNEIVQIKPTNLRPAIAVSRMSVSQTGSEIENEDRKSCVSKYSFLPLPQPTEDQRMVLDNSDFWKMYRSERGSMDASGGRICDAYEGDIRDLLKANAAERSDKVDNADENLAKTNEKANKDGEHHDKDEDSEDEIDEEEDNFDDDDACNKEENFCKMIFDRLREVLKHNKVDTEVAIALLQNVIVLEVDADWEDYDLLRSLNIKTAIWSPVGLPLGIILSMSFYERSRCYSRDFTFHVECTLAPKPQHHESRKILLCSNELLDPPEVPGLTEYLHQVDDQDFEDGYPWEEVESPDASGINPDTALMLRTYLFGDASASRGLISDRALLDFLLSASGAYLSHVRTGYCWVGNLDEIRACGADPSIDHAARGWLRHAVAVAAGAPDPVDRFYVPYDPREAKTRWGCKVLALRERLLEKAAGSTSPGPAAGHRKKARGVKREVTAERIWDLAAAGRLPWNDIARR